MIPTLETANLVMNGFCEEDISLLVKMAGDRDVAKMTMRMPHPYKRIDGEKWIASHNLHFIEKKSVTFAIRLKTGELIGGISIILDLANKLGELGYWVGKKYWNHGYCTEAAREIIRYSFKTLKLNKVYARHFSINPASGRVMAKCGMKREGRQRQQFNKWGKYVDVVEYGILKGEYRRA